MPLVKRADTNEQVSFGALYGARNEAVSIASQLGLQPLLGAAATESAVRARLPRAPVVHLATHGLAYGSVEHAASSFILLAAGGKHDGLLEAREIMSDSTLSLRATLVVLSACETARGAENRGEGTLGLQRAFLARGAASMLVSQWQVPDAPTRLLMQEFYRGWLDPALSLTKSEALRRAQSIVRARPEFANPMNWAAFQLVGAK